MDGGIKEFRELLQKNKTFTDYLNAFLNLPVRILIEIFIHSKSCLLPTDFCKKIDFLLCQSFLQCRAKGRHADIRK